MENDALSFDWPEPLAAPGALQSFGTILRLSLRQILFHRKTLLLGAAAVLPVLLAVLATAASGRIALQGLSSLGLYQLLYTLFYIHVLLLLVPGLYGISLIGDEVEAKTLTCLTTRPVPKAVILLGKLTAYGLVTSAILGSSLALCYAVLHVGAAPETMAGGLDNFLRDLAVLCSGLMVYGAIFTLFGLALKRSLIAALLYATWESVFAYIPGLFHRFTVLHYLQTHSRISSEYSWLLAIVRESTDRTTAAVTLAAIFVVTLVVAAAVFYRREYQSQAPGA